MIFDSSVFVWNYRPGCSSTLFTTWDNLLQETESDAQVHANIAGVMSRAVSRPLLEKTFHMKIQSRKIFTQREGYETILAKTEEMLMKVLTLTFWSHFYKYNIWLGYTLCVKVQIDSIPNYYSVMTIIAMRLMFIRRQ